MNDEINKIVTLHKTGQYNKALENIKILLFEENNNPILHNLSGIIYLSLKDYENSISIIDNLFEKLSEISGAEEFGNKLDDLITVIDNEEIDEQKLLSSNGQLLCEKNRIDAVKQAINQNIDIAIFDDGLQDKILSYDITFVCFNIQSWIGNGLCLPSGPLREKLKNIKKYDAVLLNGNGEESLKIQNIIKHTSPSVKIFEAQYVPTNIDKLEHTKNYLAFSGIGNPDSFIKTLKKNKFKIVKNLNFPDHYNYSDKDIIKIRKIAKDLDAKIITTEKDYNRLNKLNSEGIEFLKIELKILNENELINFLNKKL